MQKNRLGRTNFEVSPLGLGGHVYPVGAGDDSFCTPDERAQLVQHLVESGVNYFDTTWLNEVELLADSFRRAGLRDPGLVSLQYVDGISDPNWRQRLRAEVETRLGVMGYTKAPLFIMGVGNNRPPLDEVMAAGEAMSRLKDEGLIQNIGVSCHDFPAFEHIATVIEQTNLIDYMMIRYNWKFPNAAERLFPIAQAHDVGIVGMKVLCWDCGWGDWGRRISVFEPVEDTQRALHLPSLNAAQRSLLWCLQTCATTAVSINALWEGCQLLQAVATPEQDAYKRDDMTGDFPSYVNRLHDPVALAQIAAKAESAAVRGRAMALLPR